MEARMWVGALAASACALCAVPAGATTTIDIGWNTVGGQIGIATLATGSGSGVSWVGSLLGFNFNVVSGSDPDPLDFLSTADDGAPGAAGPIYVYVTETGLTSLKSPVDIRSSLTENELSPGWTVTETTFEDNSNAAYGQATTLLSHTFTGPITTPSALSGVTLDSVSSPFSITQMYEITATGVGSAGSTEHVSVVPELATWGMLVLGFAGLGLAGYRGSRKTAAFAE